MLNVVLYQPEIPSNTGNVGRTCLAIGARLHLIEPLGFRLDDKHLKRAGMDYWDQIDLKIHQDFDHFITEEKPSSLFCVSTKGRVFYSDVTYKNPCYMLFGQESAGLPEAIRSCYDLIRIPMQSHSRSLNLANSVAVVAYEVMRQHRYLGLE